ncbi:uncharacterized protein LOC128556517 [Mercenaria mercenaria]|uniref:uncharacterized protein LOC128556517 n=1 Tax=Mercenaria mercenaria TaxID=6596 RepID=UPI00234E4ACC|nr:uncharacterized protein LOC128556517 [Mercenaria mercenaria]
MATSAKPNVLNPPPDEPSYIYDNFINDLCKAISSEELKELKDRFKDVIDSKVNDPRQMFSDLKEKGYINCYNIIYIQQIIRVLKRDDLLEVATRYTTLFEEDKVLHFYEKSTVLATGCSIVEFHVVGQNSRLSREDIENLRKKISTILLVPLHEVIFKGVQETQSILVTVMLPDMYVKFLERQLRKHTQYILASLMQQNIDQVIFPAGIFQLQKEGTYFIVKEVPTSVQNEKSETMSNGNKGQTDSSDDLLKRKAKPETQISKLTKQNHMSAESSLQIRNVLTTIHVAS